MGRFLNLPLSGESTPSVKVAPLQVEILVTGGPDLSPAGPGRDPIPVGQQGWIGASHINSAYNPAELVAIAERNLSRVARQHHS